MWRERERYIHIYIYIYRERYRYVDISTTTTTTTNNNNNDHNSIIIQWLPLSAGHAAALAAAEGVLARLKGAIMGYIYTQYTIHTIYTYIMYTMVINYYTMVIINGYTICYIHNTHMYIYTQYTLSNTTHTSRQNITKNRSRSTNTYNNKPIIHKFK